MSLLYIHGLQCAIFRSILSLYTYIYILFRSLHQTLIIEVTRER